MRSIRFQFLDPIEIMPSEEAVNCILNGSLSIKRVTIGEYLQKKQKKSEISATLNKAALALDCCKSITAQKKTKVFKQKIRRRNNDIDMACKHLKSLFPEEKLGQDLELSWKTDTLSLKGRIRPLEVLEILEFVLHQYNTEDYIKSIQMPYHKNLFLNAMWSLFDLLDPTILNPERVQAVALIYDSFLSPEEHLSLDCWRKLWKRIEAHNRSIEIVE